MTASGAVLVVGTTSGAGKSTVTAGLCRSWRRRGSTVAPFKAQNMSNHAAVTADGGEVGRAQAFQATAAGVDVETAMNPILLKPADDHTSHVVVRGHGVGRTGPAEWGDHTPDLRSVVLDDLIALRRRFDMVVGEGAGGAAEINLLDRDLVNLPLAAAAGIPALLVADIDRGGAFAAAHGTVDLVPERLRATVAGIVFNRFRGDVSLLADGVAALEARTGVPVLGVLPHLGDQPLLGVEDSLDIGAAGNEPSSGDPLRVAAVRLPHLSNPSDLDPLVAEPDVVVRWATTAADVVDADVIVIPGTRATVSDLNWLRARGLDVAIDAAARRGCHIVGLCGGAQMLGRSIVDGIESDVATTTGLGLLDIDTRFVADKVVRRRHGRIGPHRVDGYQIHLGRITGGPAWVELTSGDGWEPDGAIGHDERVSATTLHGIFDADEFRRAWLHRMADAHGRSVVASAIGFGERLDDQAERLAEWIDAHLDCDRLDAIAATAVPTGAEPGW